MKEYCEYFGDFKNGENLLAAQAKVHLKSKAVLAV